MNINNLYPTTEQTGYNNSLKCTNTIPTIPIYSEQFPDYYMGFTKHIFPFMKTCQVSYNAETKIFKFNDITDYSQYPSLGYTSKSIGTGNYFTRTFRFDSENEHWRDSMFSDSNSEQRLINNFHPQAFSNNSVSLNFIFRGNYGNRNTPLETTINLAIDEFINFRNGVLSINVINPYTTDVYALHYNDLLTGIYEINQDTKIYLVSYYFNPNFYADSNDLEYYRLHNIFLQSAYKITDTTYNIITQGENFISQNAVFRFNSINSTSGIYGYKRDGFAYGLDSLPEITTPFVGNLTGSFNIETQLTQSGEWLELNENTVGFRGSSNPWSYNFYSIIQIEEVYKNMSLFRWTLKVNNKGIYGYGDGSNVWYPKINLDTNEYELELIQGTQSEIEPLLPLWWRLDNAQANEYRDSDKPSKDSEDDDPELDIETGVIVDNNFSRPFSIANQFVTTYIMTGSQLSNLGRILWTSFNDDTVTMDMLENFWANVQTATGTWDISVILNFFISVKMFPFDIKNLITQTALQSSDKLYIGTGKLGLDIRGNNNLYVANYVVAVADFGVVDIPETYGDYRDYINTVISVYLPYCGTIQLNPSDVIGKSIKVKYAIDINSGACTAFVILVDNNVERYNLAIARGMCGFSIPLTSTNAERVRVRLTDNMLKQGSSILSLIQSGANIGANLLSEEPDVKGSINSLFGVGQGIINLSRLNNNEFGQSGVFCNFIGGGTDFTDLACPSTAYVQIKRGIYSKPMHYKSTVGYPSNAKQYGKLNEFSGYVECVNVSTENMHCSEEEKSIIKGLLESGVYV